MKFSHFTCDVTPTYWQTPKIREFAQSDWRLHQTHVKFKGYRMYTCILFLFHQNPKQRVEISNYQSLIYELFISTDRCAFLIVSFPHFLSFFPQILPLDFVRSTAYTC